MFDLYCIQKIYRNRIVVTSSTFLHSLSYRLNAIWLKDVTSKVNLFDACWNVLLKSYIHATLWLKVFHFIMIAIIKFHTTICSNPGKVTRFKNFFIFNKMIKNILHILEGHQVYASQIHLDIYDPTVIIIIIICDECLADDLAKARWWRSSIFTSIISCHITFMLHFVQIQQP